MNHIDTLKQALEALEAAPASWRAPEVQAALCLAIKELEKQEPVAWRWNERGHWFDWTTDWTHYDRAKSMGVPIEYAYTAPPQRQPEGCAECGAASTDDSMHALYCVPCAEEFFKRQPLTESDLQHEYRKGFIAGQIDMRDRPEEQRQPLPDDEAWQIFEQARAGSVKPVGVLRGIRAIERKHGIGGEA